MDASASIPEGNHRLQSTYCLWYSKKASGKSHQNSFDQVCTWFRLPQKRAGNAQWPKWLLKKAVTNLRSNNLPNQDSKKISVKLTGHTYVLQQFDKFWIWRSICKTRTAEIWQKDILTLDGLEKGQLIQLDDVTRIKLSLRNQSQLAPFVCYLDSKIRNCSKQLVTPVNLTRIFFDKLFNFQDWEQYTKAKNCLLWESF